VRGGVLSRAHAAEINCVIGAVNSPVNDVSNLPDASNELGEAPARKVHIGTRCTSYRGESKRRNVTTRVAETRRTRVLIYLRTEKDERYRAKVKTRSVKRRENALVNAAATTYCGRRIVGH